MVLKKKSKIAAASFGAAMAAMYAAPELQADIVDLTFAPGSVAQQATSVAVNVQVGTTGGNGLGSFQQWNDGIGKTFYAAAGFSVGPVQYSQSLTAGATFFGGTGYGFPASATGTVYFGFNTGGNVGWFGIDLGPVGGTITYLGGEYGSAGETVHVGGTNVIPEPASCAALATLALGATCVRRRKK